MELLLIGHNYYLIRLKKIYKYFLANLVITAYMGIIIPVVIKISTVVENSIKLLISGAITNAVIAPRML